MDPALERGLASASGVLFLCSGNMARSAFADLYARHAGCALPVGSAATHFRNDHLLDETAEALAARGVPLTWIRAFRPRHVADVAPGLPAGTLVLGMARMHLDALEPWPVLRSRACLLAAALGAPADIADPVLDGADFALTFERVARCVDALVARVRARHGS